MKLNIVAVISFVCVEMWNELWLTPMMFYSFARIWSDPVWNKWTRQSVPAWLQPFSPTSMRANMNRNKNSPQHRLTFATSTSWSITVAATARLHKHVFTEKKITNKMTPGRASVWWSLLWSNPALFVCFWQRLSAASVILFQVFPETRGRVRSTLAH